jgi:hypothetical protein
MIVYLILGSLTFFVLFVIGYYVALIIGKITNHKDDKIGFDETFFLGFLSLSAITGFLSIIIPIGTMVFCLVGLMTFLLFLIRYKEIFSDINATVKKVSLLNKPELIVLCFLIFFVLTAAVSTITLGDTQTYHAQNIQWIKKYSVVPGLGNLHGRLAFNSMFFVVSSLFTFQIKDILIFPLNGVCYIVLIIKLFALYKKEFKSGTKWKAAFYIITLLMSLLIMMPDLNSPSPDIICGTLIVYLFILIMDQSGKERSLNLTQIILLNLLIFSCITFKISSIFLTVTLFLFLDKEVIKRSLIAFAIGILVISPFFIRNYYLSGYLLFPFPAIDIFNVDWKMPLEDVAGMKSLIQGWAKIWYTPYQEVQEMSIGEWILPWFRNLNFNGKLIIIITSFSIFTFIITILKKDFSLAKIQIILMINLVFWFTTAPDLRFALGFIFIGFSLTIACIFKLFEYSSFSRILNYLRLGLICLLFIVAGRRIMFPVNTIKNPSLWILPSPFGTGETKVYYSNFQYRVAVPENACFNVEIPCTNYPLTNVILRGHNLQSGFKVINGNNKH